MNDNEETEVVPDRFVVFDTKYNQIFGMFMSEWSARGWAEDRWGHEATFHDGTIRFMPLYSRRGTANWESYRTLGHSHSADYQPTARELAEPREPER